VSSTTQRPWRTQHYLLTKPFLLPRPFHSSSTSPLTRLSSPLTKAANPTSCERRPTAAMATATKQRQPRLRASCDGCFLAKVKCSKARPICSRCLTCGIECRYSPSSRAGKPRASESAKEQAARQQSAESNTAPSNNANHNNNMMYGIHGGMPGTYEGGWVTPPTSIDGSMSRTHSISSGLAFMGVDVSPTAPADPSLATEMYGPGMPWTPPSEMPTQFAEAPITNTVANDHIHRRSQSYDMGSGPMGWMDTKGPELFGFNQVSTPAPNCFPSPTVTPHRRQAPLRSKSTPSSSAGGSCTCFTVCLQSLQALHNASSPAAPPFDLVLSLNRKAVEGCAAMLGTTTPALHCFHVQHQGAHILTFLSLHAVHEKIRHPYRCYAIGDCHRHHHVFL
jgi:hypothetical protein